MTKTIKCTKCNSQGTGYLQEGRWMFECWSCNFKTYLKALNQKQQV